MQGKFVSFEGPEGCGKSTQASCLVERLAENRIIAHYTREPGGTEVGEKIRTLLQHDTCGDSLSVRSELLLFAASRAQLVDQFILPALHRGEWVICDRFIDSTMAYQGYGRGISFEVLKLINDFSIQCREPDVTFLLDLDVEAGFSRIAERYKNTEESEDRFERESLSFHTSVREGYQRLAGENAERFVVLDSKQSVEVLAANIWKTINNRFLV